MKAFIYYGMCGAFKYSTIKKRHPEDQCVFSDVKPFVDLGDRVFDSKIEYNDLTLAAIRLTKLRNLLPEKDLAIERGVTDFLQCYLTRKSDNTLSDDLIKKVTEEEKNILLGKGYSHINKILLIMRDEKFIKDVILTEPHRLKTYPSLDYYLSCQEEYIKFTKEYNTLTEVIKITDAWDYINNYLN